MEDELGSYRRKPTLVRRDDIVNIPEPKIGELYLQPIEQQFESDLETHLKTMHFCISEAKTAFRKTTPNVALTDASFLKEVPPWSLEVITALGQTHIDERFVDRVVFIKIVANHIFFSLADLKLIIYDKAAETAVVENLSNPLTAMDFDSISNTFVFGYKNGKVELARFDNAHKHLIFDGTNINEFSVKGAVSNVKFVSHADLVLVLTNTNHAFFLMRTHPTKSKFIGIQLLDGSKRVEIFDGITAHRLQDERFGPAKDSMVISTFAVTVSASTIVYFVKLQTEYNNGAFVGVREGSLKLLTSIEFPADFKTKVGSEKPEAQPSIRLTELGLTGRKKTFVVFSGEQWMAESAPAFYVVWEDILQRYEFSPDEKLILTLTTALPLPIVCCFLGSIELIVCLDSDFELNLIKLDKIRHHCEIPSINSMPDVFSKEYLFTRTDKTKIVFGYDVKEQGFCTLNSSFLQSFEVVDWESYLEKLMEEKRYKAVLKILQDLIRLNPVPLYGVMNTQGTMRCETEDHKRAVTKFWTALQDYTPVLVKEGLDSLNSEDINEVMAILEVSIEVLLKTSTFSKIATSLIEAVISFQDKHPDSSLPFMFLTELEHISQSTRLADQLDASFYIFLFSLCKYDNSRSKFEEFLINFVSSHSVSSGVLFPVKMSACNKHLYRFLYYILIWDPDLETNLSQLGQMIKEFKINDKKGFKDYLLEVLVFIYDLFGDTKLLKICASEVTGLGKRQALTGEWLLANCEELFMDCFPARTVYLLHRIFEPQVAKELTPAILIRSADEQLTYAPAVGKRLVDAVTLDPPAPGLAVFLLSCLLLPQDMQIAREYVLQLYQVILRVIAEKAPNFTEFDRNTFEFAVFKLQLHYTEELNRLVVFPDSKDPFFEILKLELQGSMKEFLFKISDRPYFFAVCQARVKEFSGAKAAEISNFLKDNFVMLSSRNQQYCQQLIRFLPIEHTIKFAEHLKDDPQLQLRILQSLESNQLNSIDDKDISKLYLRLLCQLQSSRVINALRSNNKLDINEKLEICRQTGNSRGEAFCLKKISNFEESNRMYLRLLKQCFGLGRKELSPTEKDEVLEITCEMMEDLWDDAARPLLREMIVFFCEQNQSPAQATTLIKPLFSRLFNYSVLGLLKAFRNFPQWPFLVTHKPFVERMYSHYRTLDFINRNIELIFLCKKEEVQKDLTTRSKKGTMLVRKNCPMCSKFKTENASEIKFHTCGNCVHDSCQKEAKSFRCPTCAKEHIGKLIRGVDDEKDE